MRVSPARRIFATDENILRDVHEGRPRAVDERDEDPAPASRCAPTNESRENGHDSILSGDDIGKRYPDFHRSAFGLAGNGHPATLCLRHEVVARSTTLGAKTCDGAPDKPRVLREQRHRIDAATLQGARAEVVNDDIRSFAAALHDALGTQPAATPREMVSA